MPFGGANCFLLVAKVTSVYEYFSVAGRLNVVFSELGLAIFIAYSEVAMLTAHDSGVLPVSRL